VRHLGEVVAPGGRRACREPTMCRKPWHLNYCRGKITEKPQSGQTMGDRLISPYAFSLVDWPWLPMASLGLLSSAALGFRCRLRRQFSVSARFCGFTVIGRSAHQLTLRQSSDVVGKQQNAQILVYLPATYVPGAPVTRRRRLDCNTCRLRTWVRAADLHARHT